MAKGRQQRSRGSGTGERTQSQRNKEVQCSNHDATHRLILSPNGKLSEHWSKASAGCPKTRLVQELGNRNIVQIACGDQHAMALSRGGELFTWGQNTHGQLGVRSQTTPAPKPQLVERLKGIPLAQIAAGGAHSITVSLSGAVYSWGKNSFGQLGLGDTKDRDCPSYVGALEHWKTVFISCGADHTAVLSKEGLVCTFGAGGSGQLGHNSTRNELLPRVVAELWGARVSQIACGRQHTLVYVPSLDKFYFFGSGDEGQLEDESKPNQLIPLPINSPVNTEKSCQSNDHCREKGTSKKGIKIIAGVNQSFARCRVENKNSYLNGIATLEDKEVDAWISKSKPWKSIKKNIRLIFSSEACINGSFLDKRDKHFKTSKEVSGIDMSEVKRFYEKISKNQTVYQKVQKEIKNLLPSLSSSPISPENFRVYLILPFLLQGEDGNSLILEMAQAIMKLQPEGLQTLECLWSNLGTSFFRELVILYQRVSKQSVLEFTARGPGDIFNLGPAETGPLEILQRLYQVNSRTGFRLHESNFYVPEVIQIINLCSCLNLTTVLQNLSKFPCIFDRKSKIHIHITECRALSNVPIIPVLWISETWNFAVRRQCLLQDIWKNLKSASNQDFRKILKVNFVGEQGMDDGGVSQELFSIAARTLCQPGTGPFCHFPSSLVWFPRQASSCEDEDTFLLMGTLCGMALFNQCMVPFPFPRALYKKLLDLAPTLEDLEELLPTAGRSLRRILSEECDSLDLDFTIMEGGDSTDVVELKKNGANIPVTEDNRKEYVDLYVNYILNKSVQKPFEDFLQGFLRGCPARYWKIFFPEELQVLLQGHTTFDWHLLEKNVVYRQYKKSDQTIRNFWTVFHKLPEEKKKMFLAFLSGSDRITGYVLNHFRFCIEDPQVENPDEICPYARTCYLILFLPRYSSKNVLKEKLLYAIEHNEGFGLA